MTARHAVAEVRRPDAGFGRRVARALAFFAALASVPVAAVRRIGGERAPSAEVRRAGSEFRDVVAALAGLAAAPVTGNAERGWDVVRAHDGSAVWVLTAGPEGEQSLLASVQRMPGGEGWSAVVARLGQLCVVLAASRADAQMAAEMLVGGAHVE
ncbi:protein of unknown function (plasmid) [Rhodovastum atsumiense]|uniref:hypothetical protein n=1 Tax=Rhodovastum atsumiense TaxID=504468 RepID=UPI00139F2BA3|nr:hypothetical protein [Rhodovastum atsumiense]CAH2606182.1 protein of unknown function [Rhodovastum atsumiense]